MRESRVLRESDNGKVASCLKMNLSDPRVIELAGLTGFSSVWLCNEHVPNDWANIEHCARAAKLHDVDTIVRVAKGSYSDYIKPFECDATAIMIPHVESADEARSIVEICRFHPLGKRALDGGNTDGWFCRMPIAEYIRYSNTQRYLILQIESPEAVEQIDAIAAVPGYEFLLFGPGDFTHRIGCADDPQAAVEQVAEARAKVEAAARKHNKRCMAVGASAPMPELRERNYHLTCLASDVVTLGAELAKRIEDFSASRGNSDSYYTR
jgi:4-hydroxy-2-oxoheptanedioate aldolase